MLTAGTFVADLSDEGSAGTIAAAATEDQAKVLLHSIMVPRSAPFCP